ncbi:TolC family protein, partial [Aquifex sp.]
MLILVLILLWSLSFGLGIEEAMEEAVSRSPLLKVWEEQLKRFEGLKRSATAFPNPELRFESGFFTTTNGQGAVGRFLYLLEYSQEIPLWGVRGKRKRVVEELEKAFMNLYEVEKRKLLGRVYASFYEALYFKKRYKLAEKNYQLSRELEEFVEKAHKVGQASSLDLLRAKRERRLAQAKLKVEKSLYLSKLKELGALLGKEVKEVEGDMESFPEVNLPDIPELPHIKLLRFKIRATEEEIRLFKALAKPQVGGGFILED